VADEKPGLDGAYTLTGPQDSVRLYRDWAASYDHSFAAAMDYRLPTRVADAFATLGGGGPVLDVGAGTGLLAERLAALGVGPVDGTDISPEMLEFARQKRVYNRLFVGDVTTRLDVGDGVYAGIVSSGTFTLGHVGPEALDELLRLSAPGALFVLSINTAHYKAAGFDTKFATLGDRIFGLSLPEFPIYGPEASGDHAKDTGYLAQFRKA